MKRITVSTNFNLAGTNIASEILDANSKTMIVRQFGTTVILPPESLVQSNEIFEALAKENVQRKIEMELIELEKMAPDLILVNEIIVDGIEPISMGRRIVTGRQYYVSEIADYWFNRIEKSRWDAYGEGRDSGVAWAVSILLRDCSCKHKKCWHNKAIEKIRENTTSWEDEE